MSLAACEILTDEQLATAAQEGSRDSFEQLARRLQVPLVQFLLRRARCLADAEDVAQDSFVRAYQCLEKYSTQWRFRTWLFTIAHRLAINAALKPRREQQDSTAVDAVIDAAPNPADAMADADGRQNLWRIARQQLNAEHVSALWLHYVEEMPTAEVARVLGRSRMSVKTMLFRARKRLLPYLQALFEGEQSAESQVPSAARLEVIHV